MHRFSLTQLLINAVHGRDPSESRVQVLHPWGRLHLVYPRTPPRLLLGLYLNSSPKSFEYLRSLYIPNAIAIASTELSINECHTSQAAGTRELAYCSHFHLRRPNEEHDVQITFRSLAAAQSGPNIPTTILEFAWWACTQHFFPD